ncbi:MAG: hypothetical protein KO254_10560 [Methanoculleus marisnigri]|nr:hypothetical protein [Methanoculleus marisnigri]
MEVDLIDARNQPVTVTFRFSSVDDGERHLTGIIAVAHRKTDEHLRREVCSQIDRNTEQLACLGDRIRNPLAVIIGLADMQEDGEAARKISEQARIINEIVTELDREYVASLSVRQYLRRHYCLGDDAQLEVTHPPVRFSDGTSCRPDSPIGT